jgi:hypothetical protein
MAIEEVDMINIPFGSQERPLSFLGGHFQDIEVKLTFQVWGLKLDVWSC